MAKLAWIIHGKREREKDLDQFSPPYIRVWLSNWNAITITFKESSAATPILRAYRNTINVRTLQAGFRCDALTAVTTAWR